VAGKRFPSFCPTMGIQRGLEPDLREGQRDVFQAERKTRQTFISGIRKTDFPRANLECAGLCRSTGCSKEELCWISQTMKRGERTIQRRWRKSSEPLQTQIRGLKKVKTHPSGFEQSTRWGKKRKPLHSQGKTGSGLVRIMWQRVGCH